MSHALECEDVPGSLFQDCCSPPLVFPLSQVDLHGTFGSTCKGGVPTWGARRSLGERHDLTRYL